MSAVLMIGSHACGCGRTISANKNVCKPCLDEAAEIQRGAAQYGWHHWAVVAACERQLMSHGWGITVARAQNLQNSMFVQRVKAVHLHRPEIMFESVFTREMVMDAKNGDVFRAAHAHCIRQIHEKVFPADAAAPLIHTPCSCGHCENCTGRVV